MASTAAGTDLPNALDHSHHLSALARARESSPLKGLIKYMGKPGMISLAGGFPHMNYFPFDSIGARTYSTDAFPLAAPRADASTTTRFNEGASDPAAGARDASVPKVGGPINLATGLQYSLAMGIPPLRAFMHEFTQRVFQPAYADFATYVHSGNTDGWSIIVDSLLDPGQGYFAEEFSYPSAQATAVPHGVRPVPIAMDGQGLRADDLRRVCAEWDVDARGGMKRPHLLYTVPVGQNPCGTTVGAERKKAIYDVCVEYDIIIVEDDPYYFLQQEPYLAPGARAPAQQVEAEDAQAFLDKLEPSFLKFDYQGRVIRLDSFSKTIAPGARLGWYTCAPLFAERFERQAETSTQNPNGFGQALVATLLCEQWGGVDGYLRWLRGLRAQYTMRRDFAVDCFAAAFALSERAQDGVVTLVGASRAGGKTLFEFFPPVGGMFIWIKLHLHNHPAAAGVGLSEDQADELERALWTELAEEGLLVTPGWYFNAAQLKGKGHFRIAYSYSEADEMRNGVQIFARVVKRAFQAE